MKIIVAGSRTILSAPLVAKAIEQALWQEGWKMTELVTGAQRSWDAAAGRAYGVDYLAELWAGKQPFPPRVKLFPADWDGMGKAAGPLRNAQMAAYADALIAILSDQAENKGTRGMIALAKERGLPVCEMTIEAALDQEMYRKEIGGG